MSSGYHLVIAGTKEQAEFALSSRGFRGYRVSDAEKGMVHTRAVLPDLPNYSLSLARWLAETPDDISASDGPWPVGALVTYG